MTGFQPRGQFTAAELAVFETVLHDMTRDRPVSDQDRERLAHLIITLARYGIRSERELRKRLQLCEAEPVSEAVR